MKRICWSLIVLFLGILFMQDKACAAGTQTIESLRNKFPDGAYWNHVAQAGHRYSNYNDVGGCNNPDGYTWTPCISHSRNANIGEHDCNSFDSATQCMGFAFKCAYDVYGSSARGWAQSQSAAGIKAGDVLTYKDQYTDAQFGHTVFVISVSGNNVKVAECNNGGNCRIKWDRTISLNAVTIKKKYSAPYEAPKNNDSTKPEITNVAVTNLTDSGYTVSCTVTDNVGVTKVQFPTWLISKGSGGCPWYEGTKSGNTYTFTFRDGNVEGYYMTHIYAWDAAGNYSAVGIADTFIDKTKPVITNVRITDITNDGYTVLCTAKDNIGVVRVQFPTWTINNGQDDLQDSWWTNAKASGKRNGDEYSFRVSINDHGNEFGKYITHIYAYDAAGNSVGYAAPEVEISEKGNVGSEKSNSVNNLPVVVITSIVPDVEYIQLYWKQVTGISGFEIQYCVKSDKSDAQSGYWNNGNITGGRLIGAGKLLANTTYYIRMRTYKIENGGASYSEWSDWKSVTTKNVAVKEDIPNVPSVELLSVQSKKKGQMDIAWNSADVTGYQVSYAKVLNFGGAINKTYSSWISKDTIKGLQKGKWYYVRVRAYIQKNGKTYYGNWSRTKWVKIKK